MKATRKLIPALALLLVSAVLLSTASYAWFTTNTTVEASMAVSVTTPDNPYISKNGSDWSTEINFADVSALTPASSVDGKNFWVVNQAAGTGSLDGVIDGTTVKIDGTNVLRGTTAIGTLSKVAVTDGKLDPKYVQTTEFYLRAANNVAAGELKATVTLDLANAGIKSAYGALRVAIIMDGQYFFFSDTAETNTEAITADGKGVAAMSGTINVQGNQITLSNVSLAGTVTETVTVLVWFEGNDAECVSTLVQAGNQINVGIEFVIVPTPVTP